MTSFWSRVRALPGKVPLPESLSENPQRLERFLVMSRDLGSKPQKVDFKVPNPFPFKWPLFWGKARLKYYHSSKIHGSFFLGVLELFLFQQFFRWIKGPHQWTTNATCHKTAGYKLALLTAVESLYRDYKKPFLGEASLVWAFAGWKKSLFFIWIKQ